ncbi:hypothetical protein GEMRC1_002235 [Eukaryota sp. GEM-RC1]
MPTLLVEVCPSLKSQCEQLEMSLIRRFPGRMIFVYNQDYNDYDIDPRKNICSVVWELNNTVLIETKDRCPTFEELEAILKPFVEPPVDPCKPVAGGG